MVNDINKIKNIIYSFDNTKKIIFQGHLNYGNISNRLIIDNIIIKTNKISNKIILKNVFEKYNIKKICKKRKNNNKINLNNLTIYEYKILYNLII